MSLLQPAHMCVRQSNLLQPCYIPTRSWRTHGRERIHVEQDRQIIMIARWQAAVGSSSHPPTPLHKTLWPPSLKAERASMSVHRPCSLRGVPKTRVHHLFVAWTPVICFLRAPRRLMRSDWPFNFPFINSVGWRLYRGFVRQRFHERARQPVMKPVSVDRRLLFSVSSSFSLLPFFVFFPPLAFSLLSFLLSFFAWNDERACSHRSRLSFICIPRKERARNKCLIYCLSDVVAVGSEEPTGRERERERGHSLRRLGKKFIGVCKIREFQSPARTFNRDIVPCRWWRPACIHIQGGWFI